MDPNNNQNGSSSSDPISEDVSLETSSSEVVNNKVGSPSPEQSLPTPPPNPPNQKVGWWHIIHNHFSVYLLMFGLVIVLAVAIVVFAYLANNRGSNQNNVNSQNLSASQLSQLAGAGTTVGSPNQILNIQSPAVFASKVLVKQDLQVAGNLDVGGTFSLNSLNVAGAAHFGQASIGQNLSVSGNTSVQGSLSVASSLQVNGAANFSGNVSSPQITTSNLSLNGDLTLSHHIDTTGATPSKTSGSALGGGGTASVSGDDISGSISINTGDSPAPGCYITVTFASKYNTTPHVIITPVGASAAGQSYYINRTATGFSVCTTSVPPANVSFGYDYAVFD